jgi:hypothetical protein
MVLKSSNMMLGSLVTALVLLTAAAPVLGQANKDKAVIYFGLSYNKANVENAESGFFGGDLFAGKMLTNELCLGFSCGYNIVHRHVYTPSSSVDGDGGDFTETLGVIPATIKLRYYYSLSVMFQIHGQVAAGAYSTVSSLGGTAVGGIMANEIRPGGSIGIGFDYWFLLMNGVTAEFEYHMFTTPDDGDLFKYWSVRIDYGIIKF